MIKQVVVTGPASDEVFKMVKEQELNVLRFYPIKNGVKIIINVKELLKLNSLYEIEHSYIEVSPLPEHKVPQTGIMHTTTLVDPLKEGDMVSGVLMMGNTSSMVVRDNCYTEVSEELQKGCSIKFRAIIKDTWGRELCVTPLVDSLKECKEMCHSQEDMGIKVFYHVVYVYKSGVTEWHKVK